MLSVSKSPPVAPALPIAQPTSRIMSTLPSTSTAKWIETGLTVGSSGKGSKRGGGASAEPKAAGLSKAGKPTGTATTSTTKKGARNTGKSGGPKEKGQQQMEVKKAAPGTKKPKPKNPNTAAPNLWKEAYTALSSDSFGKERLAKLHTLLRNEIGAPALKLRSNDGYKQLLALMATRARALEADEAAAEKSSAVADNMAKAVETMGRVRDAMLSIQEIVAAGVNVAGPYIAIPAAALFVAFSVDAVYRAEKSTMFKLATTLAHAMILHRKAHIRVSPSPVDDTDMRDLKARLHVVYIGLHRTMLLAAAQLSIASRAPFQYVKNLAKHYDWAGLLAALDEQTALCAAYRDEMDSWASLGQASEKEKASMAAASTRPAPGSMGPGPRNSLHWAAALSVPEQVTHFVTHQMFPINALSPQSWTAVHFAAREGNAKILKTLLTAPGVDASIRNSEGRTPLHVAAIMNKVGAVKLLLQRERGLLGVRDKGGRTAWLWAAAKGNVEVLRVLKSEGQDVNDATKGGWNALHLAGESDRVEAVKYLIGVGTTKDARIKEGKWKGCTPKELTMKKGKTAALDFL